MERVKKIKDYAFVHFEDRDSAVVAMKALNGKEVGAAKIEVSKRKRTASRILIIKLIIFKFIRFHWPNRLQTKRKRRRFYVHGSVA